MSTFHLIVLLVTEDHLPSSSISLGWLCVLLKSWLSPTLTLDTLICKIRKKICKLVSSLPGTLWVLDFKSEKKVPQKLLRTYGKNNYFIDKNLLNIIFVMIFYSYFPKILRETSGQDGGVGKHGMPPCTTTSKLQLNSRTSITQTIKIKLNGSLTITEWKKPHSHRLVGEEKTQRCGMSCPPPPLWWIKIREGYLESEGFHARPPRQCSSTRKISPITSGCKNQQGLSQWKKLLDFQIVPLKKLTHEVIQTHSLWAPALG